MGERIISENAHVQTVKYSLPNKHYIPVDMRYAGIDNLTPCVFISYCCPWFRSLSAKLPSIAHHLISSCSAPVDVPTHASRNISYFCHLHSPPPVLLSVFRFSHAGVNHSSTCYLPRISTFEAFLGLKSLLTSPTKMSFRILSRRPHDMSRHIYAILRSFVSSAFSIFRRGCFQCRRNGGVARRLLRVVRTEDQVFRTRSCAPTNRSATH